MWQRTNFNIRYIDIFLGSGLIQTQNAMMVARTTADKKLTASLS